jgi:hypothetical protein
VIVRLLLVRPGIRTPSLYHENFQGFGPEAVVLNVAFSPGQVTMLWSGVSVFHPYAMPLVMQVARINSVKRTLARENRSFKLFRVESGLVADFIEPNVKLPVRTEIGAHPVPLPGPFTELIPGYSRIKPATTWRPASPRPRSRPLH